MPAETTDAGPVRNVRTVGLDAHMVGARETGNETYVIELGKALLELGGRRYLLYTAHPAALRAELRSCEAVRSFPDIPSPLRIAWLYPRLAVADQLDVLHMSYVSPPWSPCPIVLTVHDVSYRIYPEFFSPRVRFVVGLLIGPSIRRAARVLTESECSRRDIIRFYRVSPRNVEVIPAAAGAQFAPQSQVEVARIREKYHLVRPYILALGNVQPRKNLVRLMEAFSAIAAQHPTVELVVAGQSAWRGSQVGEAVDRLGLTPRVKFLGYVPSQDLPGLYSGATLFCYPSLYEGFGLPPLEAMACGTATITSNVSSLPEVVGDAAITVSPTSVNELASAMIYLVSDSAARQDYSVKGRERAKAFSWARTARMTRDVYETVSERGPLGPGERPGRRDTLFS